MGPRSPSLVHSRSQSRFGRFGALAVLASVAFAVWLELGIGGDTVTSYVDDLATVAAALLATVLCLAARARTRAHHAPLKQITRFWTLLACAAACWTLAEVIWAVYDLILAQAIPVPSWADVGYLGAIPLAVAALLSHPAARATGTRKARTVFDGLVVAGALLFLSWTVVLGPLWRHTDLSTAGGLVSLAYPFGDVVIVFFIVLVVRGMTGEDRVSLWCLLGGLLAMAVSDSLYTYLTEVQTYATGSAIDTGWVVAYLGIALSAYTYSPDSAPAPHPAPQLAPHPAPQLAARPAAAASRPAPSLVSLLAPLLPVLLALTTAGVEIKLGHQLDRAAWIMAYGLIALVLARQALLVVELLAPTAATDDGLLERMTRSALGGEVTSTDPLA
jgi:diguanylate cyclase